MFAPSYRLGPSHPLKFIIVNSIFLTATPCLKCTAFKERKSTEVRAIIVCLAIPGKIVGVEYLKDGARSGRVQFGGIIRPVSLDFVPEASEGDYVMVHVGFPISRVNAEEAERTTVCWPRWERCGKNFLSLRCHHHVPAQRILGEVFQVVDQKWRGLGLIAQSGLGLRDEFAAYDAPARAWLSMGPSPNSQSAF